MDTIEQLERAHKVVVELCQDRRRWVMRIPLDRNHDPDVIIGGALRGAQKAIISLRDEVAALKEELGRKQRSCDVFVEEYRLALSRAEAAEKELKEQGKDWIRWKEIANVRLAEVEKKYDELSGQNFIDTLAKVVSERDRMMEAGEGMSRIMAERIRQKSVEGWTPEHDAQHSKGELTIAAACYALNKMPVYSDHWFDEVNEWWPWHPDWDKRDKHSRERSLEIAGALIAAELDRLADG
jgi:hypothetical protein